ncbi:MAG: signal peptidase II [Spirochaetota bacterium]|nr:signal peptidase II [Spirochaetota bacterium]
MSQKISPVKAWLPFVFIFITYFLDQLTKILVVKNMKLYETVNFLGDIVQFKYIENRGMAFGMFSNVDKIYKDIIFTLLTFSAILAVIYFYRKVKKDSTVAKVSFAMILGGALGNFSDKVFGYIIFEGKFQIAGENGLYGRVVDFVHVYIGTLGKWLFSSERWPTFNVADIGITVGVFLLLIQIIRKKESEIFIQKGSSPEPAADKTSDTVKKA